MLCRDALDKLIKRAFLQVRAADPPGGAKIYTIFEGTSEIQRLVIARAISGNHIR